MPHDPQEQFQELLQNFEHAMLVTKTPEGDLRARPMAVARCDSDADVWFVTDAESGKIDELVADPRVSVVLQGGGRFVSLSGEATVCRDQAKTEALWRDEWQSWFPGGADDANLVALKVETKEGESWETGDLKGLQYVFEAGKALMKRVERQDAHHAYAEL